MADLDLVDNLDGYGIPVDPMDLLQCDSCQ
jgi:hypothetical protein